MKDKKITLENFSEENRTRHVGNSQYRICRNDKGLWYLSECYSDGQEWTRCHGKCTPDLSEVIDRINSIKEEKEIIRERGMNA